MSADLHKVEFRLGRAKASLVLSQPFIATIVCGLPLQIDDTIFPPTLCTNGEWIKVHPQWVSDHNDEQLVWALAHETLHCVFQHMLRRGDRQPVKWNIAADYAINELLEQDKIGSRPANVLFDKAIYDKGGGTAEGIYNILPDQQSGGGQGGQWDNCEDTPGDASQQAQAAAEWSVKVAQAAAAAKAHGKFSAAMRDFVDQLLAPKVKWAEQLRHFFTKRAFNDRSFARPNRRFISQGLYLPGRDGVCMGDICIAVDHSGSISADELNRFAAEMRGIKEDCGPLNTHVLYFHTQVTEHETFGKDDELRVHPGPPGGTAFSPIFRFIADNNIMPEACVVLTDLECSDFGPVPDYPVMWASTASLKAPWGEIISVKGT